MTWKPATMVYVALRGDTLRKLGSTCDLPGRLRTLSRGHEQTYACEEAWTVQGGDAGWVERHAHRLLKPFRADGGSGSREHYAASLDVIADAVDQIATVRLLPLAIQDEAIEAAYKRAGSFEKAAKLLGCSRITIIRGMERVKKAKGDAT